MEIYSYVIKGEDAPRIDSGYGMYLASRDRLGMERRNWLLFRGGKDCVVDISPLIDNGTISLGKIKFLEDIKDPERIMH